MAPIVPSDGTIPLFHPEALPLSLLGSTLHALYPPSLHPFPSPRSLIRIPSLFHQSRVEVGGVLARPLLITGVLVKGELKGGRDHPLPSNPSPSPSSFTPSDPYAVSVVLLYSIRCSTVSYRTFSIQIPSLNGVFLLSVNERDDTPNCPSLHRDSPCLPYTRRTSSSNYR